MKDPVDLAAKLLALWGRAIEAPLEKLVVDDPMLEIEGLWAEMKDEIHPCEVSDVMACLRMVAVGLGAEPPTGAQLRIYQRLLSQMTKPVLVSVSEKIIAEHKYPGFPKPVEWMDRAKAGMELIAKAQLMMQLYPKRRHLAFKKYGPRAR